ncbi:master DNA invertase Mpi family serine-type recombinase [Treponema vincentii]|uniref:Master DNA invertase Mpi family serine-type recombinase n=1 Tax=Treponema vincentii TaxID=69710 RepID=A0A6P1Y316_9SPIR|nr:master DNA invertase Mpi family serine-type recombinase [Treponema vincentii]QHX44286.1 master DNA invertase Mpi family serine-type recombinase [Treponema vincentii]
MIYAYIRVSTEKQTVENQRFEIHNWAENRHIRIDRYVEEIMSGTVAIGHRKLGDLSKELQKDDVLIVSELSRLGRSLLNVMSFLNVCIERNIKVFSIKENFEFADNINSKVLAFAFSLAAEIERQLISQRTKEALALRRAQGVVLGRPQGKKNAAERYKLYGKEAEIQDYLSKKIPKAAIGRLLGVHRITVDKFIKENNLLE